MSKNNGVKQRESVTKDEITDIIMHLDEHFKTDTTFCIAFTLEIFKLFGRRYHTKREKK